VSEFDLQLIEALPGERLALPISPKHVLAICGPAAHATTTYALM